MENITYSLRNFINNFYKTQEKQFIKSEKYIELIKFKAIIEDITYGKELLNYALSIANSLSDVANRLYELADSTSPDNTPAIIYYHSQEAQALKHEFNRTATSTYNNQPLFDGNYKLSIMASKEVEDRFEITLPCLTTDCLFNEDIANYKDINDLTKARKALKEGMESLIIAQHEIENMQNELNIAEQNLAIEFIKLGYSNGEEITIDDTLEQAKLENMAKFYPSNNIVTDEFSKIFSGNTYMFGRPDKDLYSIPEDKYIKLSDYNAEEKINHLLKYANSDNSYILDFLKELYNNSFTVSEISKIVGEQIALSTEAQMGSKSNFEREYLNNKYQEKIENINKMVTNFWSENYINQTTLPAPNAENLGLINLDISDYKKAKEAYDTLFKAQHELERQEIILDYQLDRANYFNDNYQCKADMLNEQLPYWLYYKTSESGESDKTKLYIMGENVTSLGETYCDVGTLQNLALYQYSTVLKTMQNNYASYHYVYDLLSSHLDKTIKAIALLIYSDANVKENLTDYTAFFELVSGELSHPLYLDFMAKPLEEKLLPIALTTESIKQDILEIMPKLMDEAEEYIDLSSYI